MLFSFGSLYLYCKTFITVKIMKTIPQIISKVERLKTSPLKIGFKGLKIEYGDKRDFFKTIDELLTAIKGIDIFNLYKLDVEISEFQFLQIAINVSYLKENEIGKPLNLVRIARNLKALNQSNYERSDVHSTWKFWNDLRTKLNKAMALLSDSEKSIVNELTMV